MLSCVPVFNRRAKFFIYFLLAYSIHVKVCLAAYFDAAVRNFLMKYILKTYGKQIVACKNISFHVAAWCEEIKEN